MANLVSWIFAFLAGTVVGALAASRFQGGKRRRTNLADARQRILTSIREQHEQNLRREIFQTAEALHGELNRSLRRLLSSTQSLLGQVHEDSRGKKDPQKTDTIESGRV